jgi:uncharacterized membrane protein YhiD involved in acid resistance
MLTRARKLLTHPWVQIQAAVFTIWLVTGAGYDGIAAAATAVVFALLWFRDGLNEGAANARWQIRQLARERDYHFRYARDTRSRARQLEQKYEKAVTALAMIQDGPANPELISAGWAAGVAMSALDSIGEQRSAAA